MPEALIAGSAAALIHQLVTGGFPWTPAFALALGAFWREARLPGGREARSGALLFSGCAAVYLSTFRWHGGDDLPNSLLPFCVLWHGTLTLDGMLGWFGPVADNFLLNVGGRQLSVYPVSPSILALPVYLLPAAAHAPLSAAFIHNLSKISGTLITAASVVAFHRAVRPRCSPRWALCVTALYAFGSWAFSVSSQALWQHGVAQLGLALGLWGLSGEDRRAAALAGFGFSLAVAGRPDSVFFSAPAAAWVLLRRPGAFPAFMAGALIPAAPLLLYWWHYTGALRPPELGKHLGFLGRPSPAALAGLTLSPSRGMLWYFPAVLFAFWGAWRQRRERLAPLLVAGGLGQLLFFSCYMDWFGGLSFGARYLASAGLVCAFLCASLERPIRDSAVLRAAWSACVAVSMLTHAMGAYVTWPEGYDLRELYATLWDLASHPIPRLFTARGGFHAFPAAVRVAGALLVLALTAAAARRLAAALRPSS